MNYIKTNTDRYVPIPNKILEVIKQTSDKSDGSEYLFVKDGKRINTMAIVCVLEKYAQQILLRVRIK